MIFKNFFSKLVFFQALFCCIIIGFDSVDANAQEKNNNKGQVTGLPIPRFVSIKSSKVNVRRGPSSSYQIDWVYTRMGVPLKVTAEYQNWRRVEDFQGEGGWIHSRLLSGKRFIIILDSRVILKRRPNKKSPPVAIVEKGVIGRLVSTAGDWCEISVSGHSGWVMTESVWGTFLKRK